MVKPDELGRPDKRLRGLLRKLELSPQEGEDTLTHSLLYIMQVVHCVIRLHSMYTDSHRHVMGLVPHMSVLLGVGSFSCVHSYMREMFIV